MKKLLALVLCIAMLACGTVSVFASELGIFSDVDVTTDEGIAILTLYVEGIVQGYGDGTFGTDKPLTRAEFVRMINLVFGYTASTENTFSDVSESDWFYNDVLTAINAGYIKGFEDNTFRGNDNVTRQQVCSVVNRIVKLAEIAEHITITDKIDSWAEADVKAIVDNGYMEVEDGNVFRATENITRGELALLLAKFVDDSDYTVDVPEDSNPEIIYDASDKTENTGSTSGGTSSGNSSSSSTGSSGNSGSSSSGSSSGSSNGSSSDNSGTSTPDETPDTPENPEEPGESETPETPETPEEPVDNTEVLENLNKVLSDINDVTFVGKEKEMMTYIKSAIEATIAAGESGEKLTDDYVMVNFEEEVSEVKSIYNSMTEEEREAFVNKIAVFDMDTLAYLQEYFLA